MIGTYAWKWVPHKEEEKCKRELSTVIVTRKRSTMTALGPRDHVPYEVTYVPLPADATVIAETRAVPLHALTKREQDVLLAISNDEKPAETRKRLKISASSYEFYRAALKDKLAANGNAGLVRAAIRMGLIQP